MQNYQNKSAPRSQKTGWIIIFLLAALILSACTGNPNQAPQGQGPQGQAPTPGESPRQAEITNPVPPTDTPATEAERPTSPPAPASSDAKAAVIAAIRAGLESKSYRMTATTTTEAGQISEIQGEVLMPDRMHIITTLAGNPSEIIVVGDSMWIKAGESWTEMPFSSDLIRNLIAFSASIDLENTIQEAEYLGEEDLNGSPMRVYRIRQVVEVAGQKFESQSKIWVGKADGRIQRQEIQSETAGVKSTTVQNFDWDVNVVIEPPVP